MHTIPLPKDEKVTPTEISLHEMWVGNPHVSNATYCKLSGYKEHLYSLFSQSVPADRKEPLGLPAAQVTSVLLLSPQPWPRGSALQSYTSSSELAASEAHM